MARGVNKVILIGNLGRDPEMRYTPSGAAVASITLATSEVWKDKQTGENQERTEWHRIVFYQRLAEIVGEYLRKGSKIFVEGRLRTSKWQDKTTGQDRYTTEIIADNMQMLDSKGGNNMLGGGNNLADATSSSPPAMPYDKTAASATHMTNTPVAAHDGNQMLDHVDDEIPF